MKQVPLVNLPIPSDTTPPAQEIMASQKASYSFEPEKDGTFRRYGGPMNTESYDRIDENPYFLVGRDPLSTFSIDVDTASYANVRRFIGLGELPPKDAVRLEEFINYFPYSYPAPDSETPFSVTTEVASSPWNEAYRLMRIGLKGKEIEWNKRMPSNLVFLIDVSGSMEDPNKLPLLKKSVELLVENLSAKDHVAMVVYAGASGVVLNSTSGDQKEKIKSALNELSAGGSTNGGEGIELAYKIAKENFISGGLNRVILATDGDFNVGTTGEGDLTRLIEEKAKTGVFLSVLGYGMGNIKDSTLEKLADKGNGNYAYIDSLLEAKKVLVEEMGGTLYTIAKDVKIQVEFNPATVKAYRLVGYENRMLRHEDFNDDKKDAGDIGAGHTVTAFYEIVPVGAEVPVGKVDGLKYQKTESKQVVPSDDLVTVKLRYKEPSGSTSKLLEKVVKDSHQSFEQASTDFKFASTVASFGMLLRDSSFKGKIGFDQVITWAKENLGEDRGGYRHEFVRLVEAAKGLKR
ncbi:MAG TPA: hypothetical protein DDW49_00635 [Deltaproteobacteria bacterium]|nr:hypothetical protein [Deltaproteobacteria bacterium]